MKFRIKKQLTKGRFYVNLVMEEFLPADEAKSSRFGTPELLLMQANGVRAKVAINQLSSNTPFAYNTAKEADQYADSLKTQILELKKKWDTLEDTWSAEEVV